MTNKTAHLINLGAVWAEDFTPLNGSPLRSGDYVSTELILDIKKKINKSNPDSEQNYIKWRGVSD